MKKKIIIVSVLTIAIMLLMAGCGAGTSNSGDSSGDTANSNNNAANSEIVTVDTSYGEMEYPVGYEEIVATEKNATDDGEEYVFYAVLGKEKIKVYTVIFSESELSENGLLLGTTKNDDGDVINIYLLPEIDVTNDEMSDDEKDIAYSAQETLNDVVTSISNWADYKPAEK